MWRQKEMPETKMRIAYKHPFRKKILQYELEKLPTIWNNEGKQYYILGSCAIPIKDVKIIDSTTLRKIKQIEKQITKRHTQIDNILTENFSKFKEVK